MKKIAIMFVLATALGKVQAQNEPVVGLWEKIAVSDSNSKLVARTNYIFANRKLTEETVFTAFQNSDPLVIICCVKVKNLKPLELKDVLEKYRMDEEFVSHMKSVTGAPFLYEAVPVDKKEWNPLMATIMSSDKNADDLVPYNAPVIAARLGKEDEKLGKLELGPTKTKLKMTYPKKNNKAIYQFTINGKNIVLTEETFPHD
ncbi:hypothetical protein Jab_1c14130 [Janthinobacterium sp. HH01]|uniref:hypothetical protein n=1 Tax=Janthinobacterium sp. HH01 TaxID=1198452 RepID=UPI0002AEBACC|nr:hypothetical protein [Janthinobacterium sp. HH01]ELX12798.1 hypothetical protein Jab_1c14130 [Janthinobacterium sp. HH01]